MIDATMAALEKSMDLRMRAHEIHASNIANANVPGYKAKRIDFDARMQEALDAMEGNAPKVAREHEAMNRIQNVEGDIYEDPLARMSGDGNTVNMEREQTEIAKNTIAYETAIQLLSKKFMFQKQVLSDGGR
ncbi:MAG: flagellar basal body rod protein FlgB [Bdellovibrionales bacterium]|nr:flagellar basal body rod protein FlgB [Bdellovibrionales bacterium]